jgi:hypothetical protein
MSDKDLNLKNIFKNIKGLKNIDSPKYFYKVNFIKKETTLTPEYEIKEENNER